MRLGECLSLTWICVNLEQRVITLRKAEKNSRPRVFSNLSTTLMTLLETLSKQNDKVFGKTSECSAITGLCQQRKRLSHKLGNSQMLKIHFHLIRHWYGTMNYHRKPDPVYIAGLLGHKSLMTTQIYINLDRMAFGESSDYIVKVASTIDEACKLLEVGFKFVTDMDGSKIFRKLK
jgi:integrase